MRSLCDQPQDVFVALRDDIVEIMDKKGFECLVLVEGDFVGEGQGGGGFSCGEVERP